MQRLFFILFLAGLSFARPYFQQDVRYNINVSLQPAEKTYSGSETIFYKNNSPDTLRCIWLHLYPNAYKDESTPFARQEAFYNKSRFYYSKPSERGYLNISRICSGGQALLSKPKPGAIDEMQIILNRPLAPGDSLLLNLDFNGKFPVVFSRMGYFNKNYFAVSQWYPKVVVYDATGWHPDSYLNMGEFYGEFAHFDVQITLPEHFVIDATGMLQDNPAETARMDSIIAQTRKLLALAKKSDRSQFIKDYLERRKQVHNDSLLKTVRFVAHHVHDFAWFAGPDYMILQKHQPDHVLTNVLVTPRNVWEWRHVPDYVSKTLDFYGKQVGHYRYPKASVVDGSMAAGGGMEYPMITIISSGGNNWSRMLEMVVMHETGHDWFYGMLGSNERRYPFMDEGFNSFMERKYMEHYYGEYNLTMLDSLLGKWNFLNDVGERQFGQITYGNLVYQGLDQPLNLPATAYSPTAYSAISYNKATFMLYALEYYVGEKTFTRIMHAYFDRWQGKHPRPENFFQIASEISGKNMDWFVKEWINGTSYCDFAIVGTKTEQAGRQFQTEVFVRNKGTMQGMPAPVCLITEAGDTLQARWDGQPDVPVHFIHSSPVRDVVVNLHKTIFEIDYLNNRPFLPPVEVNFLAEMPKFDTYQINLFPYYWYDSFVDKHRPGIGFWSGNVLFNHLFARGHLFYGTASGKIGYKLNLSNRYPHLIGNSSDLSAELKDDDGLKRISAKMATHFVYPDDYRIRTDLTFQAHHIHMYTRQYSDTSVFEKATYSSAGFDLSHSERFMLQRWDVALHGEVGFAKDISYEKFSLTGSFLQKLSQNSFLALRFFSGALFGKQFPLQEGIFTGGDADPKHENFVVSRQGTYAPLHTFSFNRGMNMPGYANPDNSFFKGSAGSALSLDLKLKYLPVLYASAGIITDDLSGYSSAPVLTEAGIKLNLTSMEFIFPLYINRPALNEKKVAFRFLFTMKTNLNLGFL